MGKTNLRNDSNSKADRKFEKKLEFYNKIRDHVTSLAASKTIKKKKLRLHQKKLKAYDLSALSEFLPELKEPKQRASTAVFKLNFKSRKKLMLNEKERFNDLLNYSDFQSDPLAAINQHLQSTQPVVDRKPKKRNKNGAKKSKKKKFKEIKEEKVQSFNWTSVDGYVIN